jgi:hypothetical protein
MDEIEERAPSTAACGGFERVASSAMGSATFEANVIAAVAEDDWSIPCKV